MSFRLAINTARQSLLRSAPRQATLSRAYSAPSTAPGPVKEFFKHGIPVEVYPIIGFTSCMVTYATYSIYEHVHEDREHLRWHPGQEGELKYELREQ